MFSAGLVLVSHFLPLVQTLFTLSPKTLQTQHHTIKDDQRLKTCQNFKKHGKSQDVEDVDWDTVKIFTVMFVAIHLMCGVNYYHICLSMAIVLVSAIIS